MVGFAGNPSQLPAVSTSSNSCCSFQQSLPLPTVAATSSSCCNLWQLSSICFPEVVSKCQTWKLFPSHQRSSLVIAWYNYNIMATFEGLKQPLGLKQSQGLKQPLLVSGAAPFQCFQNCFKLFQIVIMSGQQPVCHPMIVICLINKVGDQFNT